MRDVGDLSLHNSPIVSVVDNDEADCLALSSLIRSMGMLVSLYESASAFLDPGRTNETACLISDIRISELLGIELRARLVEHLSTCRRFSLPRTRRRFCGLAGREAVLSR